MRHYNREGEVENIYDADYSIQTVDYSVRGSRPNINILEEGEGLLSQILSAQSFGSGFTTESHLREMFKTLWEKQIVYGTSGAIYNPYKIYTKEDRIDNIKKIKL